MQIQTALKLTSLSSCAGCAAKLSQASLAQIMRNVPILHDRNVLVNSDTADDAGVYRLSSTAALVQTVDFFTPIVDDPHPFGQIAATNAISDVYAMGGRPLTALNLLGIPADKVPPDAIARILKGGADKAKEACCVILGGHTIRLPEPVYGMAVTGMVHPKKLLTNASARAGDLLVLTKRLGTGIATTAIKRGVASPDLARKAIASMRKLNTAGAELAERGLVRAATDITGFGLMGHLASMCRASEVGAEIWAEKVPMLAQEILDLILKECIPGGSQTNFINSQPMVDWSSAYDVHKTLLTDAQTSGGLLLCVKEKNLAAVKKVLKKHRTPVSAVIGQIVRGKETILVE
jgi:selenide, water dikinase